jgi:ubiquinone/menaquinone biosynthesis C-methylase UbiE
MNPSAFNQRNRDEWIAQQAAKIPPGSRVLDVGAGRGPYRKLFAHCRYEAHDFGEEPATVGHYTSLDHVSDVLAIPVSNASFDVIVCTEVLEHVPEPIRAVHEFSRILKSGGKLILTAPLGSHLHQEPFHFYGGYTPHWYYRFLPEAGFTIQSLTPNAGFFSFLAQESARFSALLDPRRTGGLPFGRRLAATVIWATTLPVCRGIIPLSATWLERLDLVAHTTVGYHVVCVRACEERGEAVR